MQMDNEQQQEEQEQEQEDPLKQLMNEMDQKDVEKKLEDTHIYQPKQQGIDEKTQGSVYRGGKIYKDPEINSFKALNVLKQELLDACSQLNWLRPSKIQATALPMLLKPNNDGKYCNMIGQAHHGSGKTGTFVLTMLQRCNEQSSKLQCLCLCHSRELANQTYNVTKSLCYYSKLKDKILCCVPGCQKINFNDWNYNIIIGTPGKIIGDILNYTKNKNLPSFLSDFKILVIDEADELLKNKETTMEQRNKPQFNTRGRGRGKNIGNNINVYKQELGNLTDQTRKIVSIINQNCAKEFQGLLFSATFPLLIKKLGAEIAPNPEIINVENKDLSLDNIKLYTWYQTDDQSKLNALKLIISNFPHGQLIIFVNLVDTAKKLIKILHSDETQISCSALYGKDMKPEDRDKTMEDFRDGQTSVLIASNVIARGIDVPAVNLVVNYDICDDHETFLHRVGRTGRFGANGACINFYGDKTSQKILNDIAQEYNLKLAEIKNEEDLQKINEWLQE